MSLLRIAELELQIARRDARIAELEAAARVVEPVEIEWPDYHHEAMGCGLEDRGIRDRYEAMQYGWDQAIEHVAERLPEKLYATPQEPAAQPSQAVDLNDDPLQGAVDWFLQDDREFFCVANVQRTLRIGYNRANRLCDIAKARAAIAKATGGAA